MPVSNAIFSSHSRSTDRLRLPMFRAFWRELFLIDDDFDDATSNEKWDRREGTVSPGFRLGQITDITEILGKTFTPNHHLRWTVQVRTCEHRQESLGLELIEWRNAWRGRPSKLAAPIHRFFLALLFAKTFSRDFSYFSRSVILRRR